MNLETQSLLHQANMYQITHARIEYLQMAHGEIQRALIKATKNRRKK